jgi:hypothetical protein
VGNKREYPEAVIISATNEEGGETTFIYDGVNPFLKLWGVPSPPEEE